MFSPLYPLPFTGFIPLLILPVNLNPGKSSTLVHTVLIRLDKAVIWKKD
jgi:hypothetical protein